MDIEKKARELLSRHLYDSGYPYFTLDLFPVEKKVGGVLGASLRAVAAALRSAQVPEEPRTTKGKTNE